MAKWGIPENGIKNGAQKHVWSFNSQVPRLTCFQVQVTVMLLWRHLFAASDFWSKSRQPDLTSAIFRKWCTDLWLGNTGDIFDIQIEDKITQGLTSRRWCKKKIVPTLQKCVFCGDHWLIDRTTKEDQSTELDTIFIFLDIDIDLHLLKECSPQSWRLFPHWISFRGLLVLLLVRSEYLMLGNLTCGYSKPCVLDLKVNINLFHDN